MGGFSDMLFSLLLGWTQNCIKSIWNLLNNEQGNRMLAFLLEHWVFVVCTLCIAGVVMDALIYFFRWRPDYVWKKGARKEQDAIVEPFQDASDQEIEPLLPQVSEQFTPEVQNPQQEANRAPIVNDMPFSQKAYQRPAMVQNPESATGMEMSGVEPYQIDHKALDGMFGDDQQMPKEETDLWLENMASQPMPELFRDNAPTFGVPTGQREPYYQEEIFTQMATPSPYLQPVAPIEKEKPIKKSALYEAQLPVATEHPGLDDDLLRVNLGFDHFQEQEDELRWDSKEVNTAQRFLQGTEASSFAQWQEMKPVNPLLKMAQKARDFVGLDDDKAPPTLRDVQQMMDRPKAFHEPVYPRTHSKENGEL